MNAPDAHQPLSDLSVAYLKSRPKSERSPLGQFLTPRVLRDDLVSRIDLRPGMRVLDPGVGTGEFLATCLTQCPELEVFGWDIDDHVLPVARQLVPEADLTRRSALDTWNGELFDVVIGNPPYFEMRNLDASLRQRYADVISGRPNIFALFFMAAWSVLREGGVLGFVVPPSMNNGAYFDKLREFICEHFSIEYLRVFSDPFLFEDAQTAVQLIVLRKGCSSDNYIVDLGSISRSPKKRTIFSENPATITSEFENRRTLHQVGYRAVTGSVVWNNHKEALHRVKSTESVPLIWAHNIGPDPMVQLSDDHPKRPQYIRGVSPWTGPALVVNRITGSVGGGTLRCAIVPDGMPFVGENHVNVIVPRDDADQEVTLDELLTALRDPRTNDRVRNITGNTQLSSTELTHWLPLDL